MTILGIRFCSVEEKQQAKGFADMLTTLGLPQNALGGTGDSFPGAVFPAGEDSWIELWPAAEGMPEGYMLHIVVDDADAYAAKAREAGITIEGPVDAHGERIYFLKSPGGLNMSVLSRIDAEPAS